MGWYSGYSTRQEVIDTVTQSWENNGVRSECIKKAFVGNNLWAVFERFPLDPSDSTLPRGAESRFIVLFKIERYGPGNWAYKDIGADCGPVEVSCPISFLEMCPTVNGDYERDWREKVREYKAFKAANRKKRRQRVAVPV